MEGKERHLRHSQELYDWLGHGIYFWEGNPARALAWANDRKEQKKINKPFVLGAIIDLRHCLDLFDRNCIAEIRQAHDELIKTFEVAGSQPPKNVGRTPDKAGRMLDCAVLNALHQYREDRGQPEYDSVRGAFLEGDAIYPDAGFRAENHIQLCVRNIACIKGYFRPIVD